jgi:hypothetical protein
MPYVLHPWRAVNSLGIGIRSLDETHIFSRRFFSFNPLDFFFDTELLISFRIEHANENEKHGKQAERTPLIRLQRKIE